MKWILSDGMKYRQSYEKRSAARTLLFSLGEPKPDRPPDPHPNETVLNQMFCTCLGAVAMILYRSKGDTYNIAGKW